MGFITDVISSNLFIDVFGLIILGLILPTIVAYHKSIYNKIDKQQEKIDTQREKTKEQLTEVKENLCNEIEKLQKTCDNTASQIDKLSGKLVTLEKIFIK
ncbi:MAG: hypothetical protein ACPKPY_03220 [Nitrososphaeraceae archaeon]